MLSGIIDIFGSFSNSFGVWKSLIFILPENTSAFHLKRLYVLGKTHLRLKENVLAFCDERKDVFLCLFSGLEKRCFQTSSAPMMSLTELYP